jgi:NAD(P)H-hydrate epimerase
MLVLDTRAARALDRAAMERYGIPGVVLMENAAAGTIAVAAAMLGGLDGRRVVVAAGPGNNGGDAYAIARHAHNAGASVAIVALGRPRPGSDAAVNAAIVARMGIPVHGPDALSLGRAEPWDLVIDGLFGIGLDRPLEGEARSLVERINGLGAPTLAIDIPSGLDGDSGLPLGIAIEAARTATMVAPKPAMLLPEAMRWIGGWCVIDIGAPRALLAEFAQDRLDDSRTEQLRPAAIIRPAPPGDRSPP